MSYRDITTIAEQGQFGVGPAGAALALCRACIEKGLNSWCYEFGFPQILTHAVTIVEAGWRLQVHDAFFNPGYPASAFMTCCNPCGTAMPWQSSGAPRDRQIYIMDPRRRARARTGPLARRQRLIVSSNRKTAFAASNWLGGRGGVHRPRPRLPCGVIVALAETGLSRAICNFDAASGRGLRRSMRISRFEHNAARRGAELCSPPQPRSASLRAMLHAERARAAELAATTIGRLEDGDSPAQQFELAALRPL